MERQTSVASTGDGVSALDINLVHKANSLDLPKFDFDKKSPRLEKSPRSSATLDKEKVLSNH